MVQMQMWLQSWMAGVDALLASACAPPPRGVVGLPQMSKFPDIHRMPAIAIDTESTGLKWWGPDRCFAVTIWTPENRGYFFDTRNAQELAFLRREVPKVKRLIAHHAKYDAHVLTHAGVKVDPARFRCTMMRAALIWEHHPNYGLDQLAKAELGLEEGKEHELWAVLAETFGGKPTKDAQILNLHKAPRELQEKYALRDAELAWLLHEQQEGKLTDLDLWTVHDVEHRLMPHVFDMEERGVRVDLDYAQRAVGEVEKEIKMLQKQLNKLAGFSVNVNPSNSLKELIAPKQDKDGNWHAKDGTPLEKTDAGNPSINAQALMNMSMPEADLVLQIRRFRRAKEVFLEGHVLGHHYNGVLHATINQTKNDRDEGTGTGRFSITDPALQQITKRNKKLARVIRPCFIPDEGHVWVCRDYDQMDFRMFTHYAKEPVMLERYAQDPNTDFHNLAAEITNLPRNADETTGGANAKQINLGLVFGMGEGRMAKEMKLPYYVVRKRGGSFYLKPGEEAQAVFAKYHRAIPGVSKILGDAESRAKRRGYVKTMLGRHINFPGRKATHKAGGLIFQGTAADALKLKMCEVCEYFAAEAPDGRLMLVVHDEFDMDMPPENEKMREDVRHIIEEFDGPLMQFRVPIRSDAGEGPNWAEASL